MAVYAFALVVCSGLLNAIWNLFAKRSVNKIVFLWFIHLIAAIAYMPYFIYEISALPFDMRVYGPLAVSMMFQGTYILLLAKAYSIGDLSQVYPVMRGTGALLVPLVGVSFLGERLTWFGWLGLAVLLFGIFHLSGRHLLQASKGVLLSLAIGLCISGYTIADKLNLQSVSPMALIQISNIGCLLFLTRGAVRSGHIRAEWNINRAVILIGAAMAPGSYVLFLFAMEWGQAAQLAPIREIGIVFGTLFGIWILKESQGARRLVASSLILTGVAVIQIFG